MLRWLLLINVIGVAAELYLIDHIESVQQWIPMVVLFAVLTSTVLINLNRSRAAQQVFLISMGAAVCSGIVGIYFHLIGNLEFVMELYPSATKEVLFLKTVKGATPVLAPGAMVGIGLLGIILNRSINQTKN
ncbi:MAG: hypothetical protein ACJAZM_003077 [Cyclobacteriaceae bacterium]|jgi:hypothetical protein